MASSGVILVVEDDPDVRAALRAVLGDHGFVVTEAATGREAKAMADDVSPDVILLDLGLPDVSGLDLLIDLTRSSGTPVIILTGRSGEADAAVGLDLGADDYITKPFGERELVARVNAALRRTRRVGTQRPMTFGSLAIDRTTRDVTVDDRLIELTPKEFELLTFLAESPRQVFNRGQLLEQVWGSSPKWQDDNTVGEHVYRIRRKLDPDNRARWIETVRGVGYRFGPARDRARGTSATDVAGESPAAAGR